LIRAEFFAPLHENNARIIAVSLERVILESMPDLPLKSIYNSSVKGTLTAIMQAETGYLWLN
jgi:hypothetical protein